MRGKKGFTLVEILVVLVIIGILVALILPNTLKAIRQANVRECASNIRTINSAIQMCFTETRDWAACDDITELTSGGWLDVAPVCPFGDAYAIIADTANPPAVRVDTTTHFATWPQFGDHL